MVDVRLGRIEIFAYFYPRFEYPAAKGDHLARHAVYGKHYPAGKQVVDASVLAFATQSRFEQELCLVAPFLGLLGQCVTLLGRIAKPELADNIFVEAPFPEIGHTHRAPLFGLQQRMAEKLLGKSVDHKHAFAFGSLLFLFVGQLLFMNLDVVFLGQVLQRFVIGELLVLHDKVYGTAAFPATETFAHPFRRRDAERGRFVVVKRTQPPVIGSPSAQADEVGDDVDNVGRGHNLIDGCLVYHLLSFLPHEDNDFFTIMARGILLFS